MHFGRSGLVIACSAFGLLGCAIVPALGRFVDGTLCDRDQRVVFHCDLEDDAVSVCANVEGTQIRALSYRLGTKAHLGRSFDATEAEAGAFHAQLEVLSPEAKLRELWFEQGGQTTLLGQCVGGDCVSEAGLTILFDDKVVSHHACRRDPHGHEWFSEWIANFGNDSSESRSATPIVAFRSTEHRVASYYIGPVGPR
jgi:hypothetical protein